MSQAGSLNDGVLPPEVPLEFDTSDGNATPAANVITFAADSDSSNTTDGFHASAGGSTVTYTITNRINGNVATADATATTVTSLALGATPGVYTFDVQLSSFNTTDTAGAGYSIFGAVRTDGATATLIGTPDKIVNEEAAMVAADANLTVSGNTAIVEATGIAGKSIDWRAVATFVFVS